MIEVESVSKSYGRFLAVNDVSLAVRPGEVVAFVGPNGAGKSTLLKMLSTYLTPTRGTVRVDGLDVLEQPLAVRRRIGYLPENNILYEAMRVDRFLAFVGSARGLAGAEFEQRLEWAVETFELREVLGKRIEQCSKGYHRRVAMAMALIHDPRVILLDEPTHGLDPLQVLALRDFIVGLKPGRAILFSSHIFQEVIAICDRLLVINRGRLLADGALIDVALAAGAPMRLELTAEAPPAAVGELLERLDGGRPVAVEARGNSSSAAEVEILRPGLLKDVEAAFDERGLALTSLLEKPCDLELLFADLVRRSEAEEAR